MKKKGPSRSARLTIKKRKAEAGWAALQEKFDEKKKEKAPFPIDMLLNAAKQTIAIDDVKKQRSKKARNERKQKAIVRDKCQEMGAKPKSKPFCKLKAKPAPKSKAK